MEQIIAATPAKLIDSLDFAGESGVADYVQSRRQIQIFPNGGNIARHPSQIYEAILEGIILFIIINYIALKKQLLFKTGYISCYFLILYSILRILAENFREPDIHLGFFFNYFSLGTLLSLATLITGLTIIMSIKKNEQNN